MTFPNLPAGRFVAAILAVIGAVGSLMAVPPGLIRYQAQLSDAAGVPLTGQHRLIFTIYDQGAGGEALWTEDRGMMGIQDGAVDILLGASSPLSSDVLTSGDRWLEVSVDSVILTPRQRLASVPFSLVSDRLGTMNLADVMADTDARVATHAGVPSAHHAKTINAGELVAGKLDNARLNMGAGGGIDADFIDGLDSSQICNGAACAKTAEQIAMLRWYEANEAGNTFAVGLSPEAAVFDGHSIWVTNSFSNSVTRLRTSDGLVLGTTLVGVRPDGIAFDGAHVWVVNAVDHTVTKIRALDGVVLNTISLGSFPAVTEAVEAAFDGTNIWISIRGPNDVLVKVQVSDGALLATIPVGDAPSGVAFDGSSIWVANTADNNVMKLRPSDGQLLGTFPVRAGPDGLAFDGSSIWVVNVNDSSVTKLRASDGVDLGTFPVGNNPRAVAFDGASVWVVAQNSGNVTKLRASDGALLGAFSVGAAPRGLVFDGSSIWVMNANSSNVQKL